MNQPRDSLKNQLKRRFEDERLDDRQFAEIERMFQRPGTGRNWFPAALAAAAALVLGLAVAWILPLERGTEPAIAERMAREVVTNHTRIKALDVESAEMAELRARLDQLDFAPLSSRLLAAEPVELRGGRYCTLQGVLATQIVYQTPEGLPLTHYQAIYKPEIFGPIPDLDAGQEPLVLHHRGLEIRIWVENGLLMAAAR